MWPHKLLGEGHFAAVLRKKEIGEETKKAQESITALLSMLSTYYTEDKKGELEV